jgi:hypothetical protein
MPLTLQYKHKRKTMKVLFATHRILDSVYTLQYQQIDEKTVKILQYDRDSNYGYENEGKLEQFSVVTDDKGIVTGVHFRNYQSGGPVISAESATRICSVANPQHKFSYIEQTA